MAFSFGQYLRSPIESYTTSISLPSYITQDNIIFEYNTLSMETLDTYYFILTVPAMLSGLSGTIYLKENEESDSIVFFTFEIPALVFPVVKTYSTETLMIEDLIINTSIEIGDFVEITNSNDPNYGNIYKKVSADDGYSLLVGNRYDYNGFPQLKNYNLEKVLTIRGLKTYTILGVTFNNPCTGWNLTCEKVKELMGNSNFIPYTRLKHVGIQGRAGMRYCINGNELRLTTRGVEEHYAYNENNPIYSIKVIPKQDFFLIDYEYE